MNYYNLELNSDDVQKLYTLVSEYENTSTSYIVDLDVELVNSYTESTYKL